MPDKPLAFPDADEPAEVYDEDYAMAAERGRDPSWVPGYSNKVKANDLSKSEELSRTDKEDYYQRFGTAPENEMPYQFKWVRYSGPNGGNSNTANQNVATYKQKGYRFVTEDMVGQIQAKMPDFEIPPAASPDENGIVSRMDTALMVVDGERARALKQERQRKADRQSHAADSEADVLEEGQFQAASQFQA